MFTPHDMITMLLLGMAFGTVAGAVVYEIVRTAGERRRRIAAERRVRELRMRLDAASQRADAFAMLLRIANGHNPDTHNGSRKAPAGGLRVVQ